MSSRKKANRGKKTGNRAPAARGSASPAQGGASPARSARSSRAAARRASTLAWLSLALRLGIGVVLVYASIPKLAHPGQFADIVTNYRVLPALLVPWLALTLPWLELIIGVFLVLGVVTRAVAILSTAMFAAFTVGLVSAQVRHLDIACGCFNVAVSSGKTSQSLWEAVLLLLASIALVIVADRSDGYAVGHLVQILPARRRFALGVILAVLAALLAGASH